MSTMREQDEVIAVLVADLHLSAKPPVWRSTEDDWYAAMLRHIDTLNKLVNKYDCPVLCAGDIFDRWNSPPELINFALSHLPLMYAIPGQHDLPLHNYSDMYRSAYCTLLRSGKIVNLLPDRNIALGKQRISLTGYPYGLPIKECNRDKVSGWINIALVHEYRYVQGCSYKNPPKDKKFGKTIAGVKDGKWLGYDLVVYGDNHIGFQHQIEDTTIWNCGGFMRRNSDEINYKPRVGLLHKSGKVTPHYFDLSNDSHMDPVKAKPLEELDMEEFAEALNELGNSALDYLQAMKHYLQTNKTGKAVKKIILECIEDAE